MMENSQISQLANCVRSSGLNKINIFSISTNLLESLLSSFELIEEEQLSTSFYLKQGNNLKMEFIRDLQLLSKFVEQTKSLKLYEDNIENLTNLKDITKFRNLIHLELHKVNVNMVRGTQKLRSQLQKLVCYRTANSLTDILISCGADQSDSSCWNELKEISLVNNGISELDGSLEYSPWLHTIDLSHNQIKDINVLTCLHHLKHLNLSYNKLESFPHFKGQICSRLQNVILKNNFIEDISGLQSLSNLWVLDLSNNCLIDHKSLLSLSHLATLQWLSLDGNPLSFHPHHRNKAASYLHANTASTYFVLDYVALSKGEKSLVGSLHPVQSQNLISVSSDSVSTSSDRIRKVRHVVIEDASIVKQIDIPVIRSLPQQHLETKRQIEDLYEQYGESWLNSHSGLLVQSVLGLEVASPPVSSSPYEADFAIHSTDFQPGDCVNITQETEKSDEASYVTAFDATVTAEDTDDDDTELGSEESTYLVTPKTEDNPILIVITGTHFCEKESSSGNERMRWHIRSVINCEILDEPNLIQLDFETMRKDKKQRMYYLDDEDLETFVAAMTQKINSRQPKEDNKLLYLCMKCSTRFVKVKNRSLLSEPTLQCPSCDSTLIVEDT